MQFEYMEICMKNYIVLASQYETKSALAEDATRALDQSTRSK